MSDDARPDRRLETLAVHGDRRAGRVLGAVVAPIFQTATWLTEPDEAEPRYLRYANAPDLTALADRCAALEGTEAALLASSGMAALTTALLSVVREGEHVIAQDCLYGGMTTFLRDTAPRLGIDVSFVSLDRPDEWAAALRPRTRAVHVEAISNPLMGVGRLDEVVDFARAHGLVSLIDSTFATPVAFRPADMGFDLVVHSATKFLGGHSDLVAGLTCGSRERLADCRRLALQLGGCLDPHAAFLLGRGLKTLPLRVRAASDTALRLARELEAHPAVERVHHPGLESHSGHARARAWFAGFGAMLSFVPQGGVPAAERILGRLRVATVAPSLGGVETLVSRPARTSHQSLSRAEREALGIPDEMVRVSVGLEHLDDLVEDFGQALAG
jgi:cystathionine gamma-synthase/cystathionine gamma-lyase/cystathionine beta-lyase